MTREDLFEGRWQLQWNLKDPAVGKLDEGHSSSSKKKPKETEVGVFKQQNKANVAGTSRRGRIAWDIKTGTEQLTKANKFTH